MKTNERIKDINENGNFDLNEVKHDKNQFNSFTSIEYYLIFHFTNEEIYFTPDEKREHMEEVAEDIINTEKGIIFCFK